MTAYLANPGELHRRKRPRLRLGIRARLETLDGTYDVELLDISQTGAKLHFRAPVHPGSAVLQWLDYEAFGETVWKNGAVLGMRFDPDLPDSVIVKTRELAHSAKSGADVTSAAKAWATGDFSAGQGR